MELFLSNIPDILNDNSLKKQLHPFTQQLDIEYFSCRKHKKSKTGTITFVNKVQGKRFLDAHGERPIATKQKTLFNLHDKPRFKARLHIFNQEVYCRQSKNEADPLTIKTILHDEKKQKDQQSWIQAQSNDTLKAQGSKSRRRSKASVTFDLLDLECGHLAYLERGNCAFATDDRWDQHDPRGISHGKAKFGKFNIILTLYEELRVEVPFKSIHELVVSEETTSFTLILTETPRFYDYGGSGMELGGRMRQLSLSREFKRPRVRLTSLQRYTSSGSETHARMSGMALVYRLTVGAPDFREKLRALQSRAFLVDVITCYRIRDAPISTTSSMIGGIHEFEQLINEAATNQILGFDVLFQLQLLVTNGYLLPQTVIEIMQALKARVGTPRAISARAITKILRDIPFPGPGTLATDLECKFIMQRLDAVEVNLRSETALSLEAFQGNENQILVYKASVTPTHVTLQGPELEHRNRILRKYPQHTDYFIRVQFEEEDGSDLLFSKVDNERVYERFKKILTDGFMIAGRTYTFFGFSHSSLRSHSAWFNAPFFYNGTLHSYVTMIPDLGDFSKIRVVARCAARIGQAFSETPYAVNLETNGIEVDYIPDLKSPDGLRVFSDGVGKMSYEACVAVSRTLPDQHVHATAVQFRLAGSKGMLSLDPTLDGNVLCIRKESMEKFSSNDMENLEICGTANKALRLVLNRQNIKILEDMGVRPGWFLALQDTELNRLRGVTKSTLNTSVFLAQLSTGDSIEFPKFLKRLERRGIDYRTDLLLCSIVEAVVLQELRLLKHKARIPVRDGVTLYGVVDETGLLEEDEVYVTFDPSESVLSSPPRDETKVLVTRSPALHPGDVQYAVNRVPPLDHPLRYLHNCIIFSQKGDRDLPSMLSGGDLDGDMYHAIWDPKVFRGTASDEGLVVHKPADYERPQLQDIGRTVIRKDMAHFLIDFMKTDQLGRICTRHLILADQMEEGTRHPYCQELAELASCAVDFSKTGIPADVSKLHKMRFHDARPDFMALAPEVEVIDKAVIFEDEPPIPLGITDDDDEDVGVKFQYYQSDKILGRLYRAVDEKKIWHDSIRGKVERLPDKMLYSLLAVADNVARQYGLRWEHLMPRGREICTIYEDAMQRAMEENAEHPHIPLSEVEVFIGQVFNKRGSQTRRQRDRSEKLRSTYDRIGAAIWKIIQAKPIPDDDSVAGSAATTAHADGGGSGVESNREVLELALACFKCSLKLGDKGSRRYGAGLSIESFKIVAGNLFLKELEIFEAAGNQSWEEEGEELMGGGYVGARARNAPRGGRGGRMTGRVGGSSMRTPSVLSGASSLAFVPSQVDTRPS